MRSLTTDFKTAIASDLVRIGLLCEIDYPGAPLRAWTGQGSITWASKTWYGVGDLGGISAVQETTATQANNVIISISGISSANLALALADSSQRRRASLWLALFEEDVGGDWDIIADPWRIRRGWTDVHKILVSGATAHIEVSVESVLARLRVARTRRYTMHDHQRLFPTDTGMRHRESIGRSPLYFGGPAGAGSSNNSSTANRDGGASSEAN